MSAPDFPLLAYLTIDLELALSDGSGPALRVPVTLKSKAHINSDGTISHDAGAKVLGTWTAAAPPPPPPPPAKPANIALPTISGTAKAGETLTCSQGQWSGNPQSFAYQWQRDSGAISGETQSSYIVQAADEGHELACEVTATGAGGQASASSAPMSVSKPAPSGGSKSLVGYTCAMKPHPWGGDCPGGEVDLCAAKTADSYLALGKVAQLLQKTFLNEGVLPATPSSAMQQFAAQGGSVLQVFKPPKTTSAADDKAFQTCLEGYMKTFGPEKFKCILWQEMNLQKDGFTPASYKAYAEHYTPLVRAVSEEIVIVWDAGAYGGNAPEFYPGDDLVDEVSADVYAENPNYVKDTELIAALADSHAKGPVPFGFAEFGYNRTDQATWDGYVKWLIGFISARLDAGKPSGWLVYFGSEVGDGKCALSGPSDFRIPGLKEIISTLGSVG